MRKVIPTGIAVILSLGLALPAFAAHNPRTATRAQGTGTTTPVATTTAPGVRAGGGEAHGKAAAAKTLQGTVKSVSGTSLILTTHSTDYTVTTAASTRIVNRTWKPITLADIRAGDTVRAFGSATGTAVEGKIVRDISLPIASSTRNR